MINIVEFMKESREARRAHIDLNDPCIERGGNSTIHRGVLAQYLNTEIPATSSKPRVLCCHACGNGKCSNPKHLYWGTDYDNAVLDETSFGKFKNAWERAVEKYGLEEAIARNARNGAQAGNKRGSGNKGKPKSEEHRKKLAAAVSNRWKDGTYENVKMGRKKNMPE